MEPVQEPVDEIIEATRGVNEAGMVAAARAAAEKIAARIVSGDGSRSDRARGLLVAFMARSAQRVAETTSGVGSTASGVRLGQAISMVRYAMTFVEKYPGMTSTEKKDSVCKAVMDSVDRFSTDMRADERDSIAEMVADAIELAVDAKHGKLDPINAILLATDVAFHGATHGCLPCRKKK